MKSKIQRPIMDMIYSMAPEELVKEGFPAEVVNLIGSHDSQDRKVMERLAELIIQKDVRDDVVHVTIDLAKLVQSQTRVEQERHERRLEDQFLINGASNGCMMALFGLTKEIVTTRRSLLDCKAAPHHGRPNQERSDDIIFLWQRLRRINMEEREAILEVHRRIRCPISVIWNAIKRYEADQVSNNERPNDKETA